MISIVVVDRQAESRTRLVEEISQFLQANVRDLDLIPRVNIVPLSRQELKFHSAPDLCIIGPGIIEQELTDVSSIRKLFPSAAILARLRRGADDLAFVEQLARMGIDDVLSEHTTAQEFLKKLILLARRVGQQKAGTLIVVDSGKGGVGVTSVVAGLGDALVKQGRRTALIDFDFDTQDLSRFLQARPFINENLQLLFDQTRPVTQEFVEQCLVPVWEDEPLLRCMTPVSDSENLFDSRSTYPRTLISILEIVDALHEYVIVDAGCARGAFLKTLYRLADAVVFVANNDPASLYASVDRLKHLRGYMAPDAKLVLASNGAVKHGVPEQLMREEFSRMVGMKSTDCRVVSIPDCRAGARWPGSGGTLLSQGKDGIKRGLDALVTVLTGGEEASGISTLGAIAERLRRSLTRKSQGEIPSGAAQPKIIEIAAQPAPLQQLPEPVVYSSTNSKVAEIPTPPNAEPDGAEDLRKLVGNVRFS